MNMMKLKDTVAIRFQFGESRVKLVMSRVKLASMNVAGFVELVRHKLGQRLGMCPSTRYGLFERFFDDGIERMLPDTSLLLNASGIDLVIRPKSFYELKDFAGVNERRIKKCYRKLSNTAEAAAASSATEKAAASRGKVEQKPAKKLRFDLEPKIERIKSTGERVDGTDATFDLDLKRSSRLEKVALKLIALKQTHKIIAKRRRTTRAADGFVVNVSVTEECLLFEKQTLFSLNCEN